MNAIDRSRLLTMVWFILFVGMVTSRVVQIVCEHHSDVSGSSMNVAIVWDVGDAFNSVLFPFGGAFGAIITQHGQAKINGKQKFVNGLRCTTLTLQNFCYTDGAGDAGGTALTIDLNSAGFGELEQIDGKLNEFDDNDALFGSPSYVLCFIIVYFVCNVFGLLVNFCFFFFVLFCFTSLVCVVFKMGGGSVPRLFDVSSVT